MLHQILLLGQYLILQIMLVILHTLHYFLKTVLYIVTAMKEHLDLQEVNKSMTNLF